MSISLKYSLVVNLKNPPSCCVGAVFQLRRHRLSAKLPQLVAQVGRQMVTSEKSINSRFACKT